MIIRLRFLRECLRVLLPLMDAMIMAVALDPDKWQLLEGQIFNWSWFTFQRFSSLSACRKHGNTQADMVLERSWEFNIWIHRQQVESNTGPDLDFWNLKVHPLWHTSSNRATPTPTEHHFHSLWVSGDIFILTTTGRNTCLRGKRAVFLSDCILGLGHIGCVISVGFCKHCR